MRIAKFSVPVLIIVLLFIDSYFSLHHFLNAKLDGDLVSIVAPADDYSHVLMNPLGIGVWVKGAATAAPNRFAAHHLYGLWMNKVPLMFTGDGPDALYFSAALLKALTHFGWLLLLLYALTRTVQLSWMEKGVALLLCAALFQDSSPFEHFFGVVSPSPTYAFFYGTQLLLTTVLILLALSAKRKGVFLWTVAAFGIPFLALGGPLNAPMIGISALVYAIYRKWWPEDGKCRFDSQDLVVAYVLAWVAYSFWLGQFNIENRWSSLSLADRYARMGEGLGILMEAWQGPWFFVLPIVGFNLLLMPRTERTASVVRLYVAMGIFIVIWLLLLPLGGFRSYRPYVVRSDTLAPITLLLIWMFAHSSLLAARRRTLFAVPAVACAAYFACLDWTTDVSNAAERAQFARFIQSKEECTVLPREGTLMHWDWAFNAGCEASRWNVVYLNRIGVMQGQRLYRYESRRLSRPGVTYASVLNKQTDLCLDVSGTNDSPGSDLILWRCHGEDNQLLQVTEKSIGAVGFSFLHSDLCADIFGGVATGNKLIQWPCHDGDNQRFEMDAKHDGYFAIRTPQTTLCLEGRNGANTDSGSLTMSQCHGGDSQLFRFK